MTLREYSLRWEAYQLRKLSEEEAIASLAWANQTVQATTGTKHPKPKFKRFESFFDRNAAEAKIRRQYGDTYALPKSKKENVAKLFLQRYEEYQHLKRAGRIDQTAWQREEAD